MTKNFRKAARAREFRGHRSQALLEWLAQFGREHSVDVSPDDLGGLGRRVRPRAESLVEVLTRGRGPAGPTRRCSTSQRGRSCESLRES